MADSGTEPEASRVAPPIRWRLAGLFQQYFPEWRGRDRLSSFIIGDRQIKQGLYEGSISSDLRFCMDLSRDSSLLDLYFLQFIKPSLLPVLEGVLSGGACFYDIGANIGVYTLWASRLIGSAGEVHSFEPVPATRDVMCELIAQNEMVNVRVVAKAAGRSRGRTLIHVVKGASGLSSIVMPPCPSEASGLEVEVVAIDDYVESGSKPPDLVKIDVEGYELEVIRGMTTTISAHKPVVVFEALPQKMPSGEGDLASVEDAFRGLGYRIWSLGPKGMVLWRNDRPPTTNLLAAHPAHHAMIMDRLAEVRFRRNQTI